MDMNSISWNTLSVFITMYFLLNLPVSTKADKSRCVCRNIGKAGYPPVRLQCLYVCGSIAHRQGEVAALPIKRSWRPQTMITNEVRPYDKTDKATSKLIRSLARAVLDTALLNYATNLEVDNSYDDFNF